MNKYLAVYKRDIHLIGLAGGLSSLPLVFFILVALLFVFTLGPETSLISKIASGIMMVGLVLAGLLSINRIFSDDAQDGALTRMLFSPCSLYGIVLAKTAAHWTGCMLPLLLIAPIMALLLSFPSAHMVYLIVVLVLQSFAISFAGTLGSALSLFAKSPYLLLPIILFPLLIPPMIFGGGTILALLTFAPVMSHLYLLCAYVLFLGAITPPLSAFAIRSHIC